MVKNRSLARAISDAAWSEFRNLLEYKAAWYRREVIPVDRFFPSSKLCSTCGTLQCCKDSGVVDEIPGAYKPIERVIDEQRDLVKVVAQLKQLVCVKG